MEADRDRVLADDAMNALDMINENHPNAREKLRDILDDINVHYDAYKVPLLKCDAQLLALMRAANCLGNPHVIEVYSPPRVTSLAHRFGLRPGMALDLTTVDENGLPWDFVQGTQRGNKSTSQNGESRSSCV